jgi:hypothetical protein
MSLSIVFSYSKISYKVEEYRETHICVTFENTIVDHLSKIKEELFTLLRDLLAQKVPFDLNRMKSIIKMKICETIDRVGCRYHLQNECKN